MTMGFKYQMLACSYPQELLHVTLNHLYQLRAKVEDAEQVVALRDTLEAEAGIPDLEADLVDPSLPGFAKHAAEIFHRDGFVIVKVRSH